MLSLSQSLVLGSQYNWEELQRFPSSSTHSLPQLSTLPTRVGLSPVMSLPLLHCHPVCKVYHPASLMMVCVLCVPANDPYHIKGSSRAAPPHKVPLPKPWKFPVFSVSIALPSLECPRGGHCFVSPWGSLLSLTQPLSGNEFYLRGLPGPSTHCVFFFFFLHVSFETKGQQQQKIKSPAVPFSEVFCLIFNGASEFGQTTNYTLTSAQKTPLAPRPWVCLCLVASSLAAPFVMPDFPTSHSVLRVSNCPKEKSISKHQVSSSRCLFFHDRLAQLQMSQQPFQASRPTPSVDFSLPRSLSKSLTRASSQPKDFPTYSHDGWFLS